HEYMTSVRTVPLLGLLLLAACDPTVPACSTADAGTGLSYANFGQQFLSSYCTQCHGTTLKEKGVDLSTMNGVTSFKGEVINQAGAGAAMPPAGVAAPTSTERSQLVEWLSCGGT